MRLHLSSGRLAGRASLLALGAIALHQLRYVLAYGGNASAALEHQGHSYLVDVVPLVAAMAMGVVLARLLAASLGHSGEGDRRTASPPAAAITFALSLLAMFSVQELSEGALSSGHPVGFAAVIANGGWIAIPLALAIGSAVALVDRLLSRVERELSPRRRGRRARRALPTGARLPPSPDLTTLATHGLSFGLARRPPPPALTS